MLNFLSRIKNASSPQGTTAFERIFIAQKPWSAEEAIRVVAHLHAGEADFSVDDVLANAQLALREHPRLSSVITDDGLWRQVDVDLAQHVVSLPSCHDEPRAGDPISEEPALLCEALSNMKAFKEEGRPLWQVIVTPRKVVLDVHHGLVDGMGLAVIAASMFQGKTLEEVNEDMCAAMESQKSRASVLGESGCWAAWTTGFRVCWKFWVYVASPLIGALAPERRSAVFACNQPQRKNARLVHVGPYELMALKRATRGAGKLNGVLVHAVSQGVHSYCRNKDGEEAALVSRMAVPVSFKKPQVSDPNVMQANNDFSTLVVDVPSPGRFDVRQAFQVSRGEALSARFAQVALSLLPVPCIRPLYLAASRMVSFIFSNVDASWSSELFQSPGSSQPPRRIRAYGYGAPAGTCSLFVMVNSHGPDVHIGVTAGCQITDPVGLSAAIHQEICQVIEGSSSESASSDQSRLLC